MPEVTEPTTAQLETELTGQQQSLANPFLFGNAWLWANGGCQSNPCAFPDYGTAYGRSYSTYDWMLRHPIVQLVRENRTAPIRGNYWQYKAADDSVPQARVVLIQEMFDLIRAPLVDAAFDGQDYGWQPFEPLWDNAGGETRLIEVKALEQRITNVLTDKHGKFVGLQQGSDGLPVQVDAAVMKGLPFPYKAFVYTYRKKKGNVFGISWLENIRETAWKDWLDCAQQLQKIGAKLAGTQVLVKSPEDKKDASIAAVKALANGAPGAWLPSLAMKIDPGGQVDLWKLVIELSKSSLIDFEVIDFGSTAPAIDGILNRMKHDEELMFAGGLRSSRTGLEGQHGTKAEAGVHTDTGMLSAEADDDDICMQVQPLVDAVLELNFGSDARGSVTLDAPPLIDAKSQRFSDFLTNIGGNQNIAQALANYVDIDELLEGLDLPIKEGAVFEIKEPVAPPSAPPINGKGALDPRVGKALLGGMKRGMRRMNGG